MKNLKLLFLSIILALAATGSYGATKTNSGSSANNNTVTKWVTRRAPLPTDDSAHAYATGQFWNYDNNLWLSKYVGAGKANWQLQQPPSAPLCDTVTGCVGAYGVYRLSSTYTGYAFQVTRSSDSTTLDIGFDSNGIAQWSAVDKFCVSTSCGFSVWYDQSGNAYDLTQGTFANMPQSLNDTVQGMRAISFNGGAQTGLNQYLSNASLPVSDIRNFTIAFVGRQYLAAPQSQSLIWQLGLATNIFYFFNGDLTASPSGLQFISTGSVGSGTASGFSFTSPEVMLTTVNSRTVTVLQNDQIQTFSGQTGASSVSTTGFRTGYTTVSTASTLMDALAFVVYNTPLSTANSQALLASSYQTTGIQPQIRDQMVMIGSSILAGATTTVTSNPQGIFAGQLVTDFDRPMNQINLGRGAITAQTASTLASAIASRAYLSGAMNYQVTDGVGSNDLSISTSTTPTQVCGYYSTISSAFSSAGFRTAASTILPRNGLFSGGVTGGSFETNRLAFNSLLLGGCNTYVTAYVDPGNDPTIGTTGSLSDTALYAADQTHTTVPLGASYVAASWLRGLITFLQ